MNSCTENLIALPAQVTILPGQTEWLETARTNCSSRAWHNQISKLFHGLYALRLSGLDELQELKERNSQLEELYKQAVKARDVAIEERDKATVLIALQLEKESAELNKQIKDLRSERERLLEQIEDFRVRLLYARDDLGKLQQKHIALQLEFEDCVNEKEDALEDIKRLEEDIKNGLRSEKQVKDNKNAEISKELERIGEEVETTMDCTKVSWSLFSVHAVRFQVNNIVVYSVLYDN